MKIHGINLTEGSDITNITVPDGTTFPDNPNAGELFFKTSDGLYVYDGSAWSKIGAAGGGGGSASSITFTAAGNISSTNVQSAIEELDSEKAGLSLNNTFTGQNSMYFADGTESSPSIRFYNDASTGWYQPNNNTWALSTLATETLRINENSRILIGSKIDDLSNKVQITGGGLRVTNANIEVQRDDGQQADVFATTYGVNGGGILHGRMARGTIASPSAILAGDIFGGVGSRAYYSGGNTFQNSSPTSIHWVASENQTSTGFGSYLRILTTPKGSTTRQERVIISDVGTLWVHDTATYDPISESQTRPIVDSYIVASSTGGSSSMTAIGYGNYGGGFRGAAIGGTAGTPTATVSGALMTFLAGHGHTGSSLPSVSSGLIKIVASENYTATATGSEIVFATTANTTTTRTDRLKVTNSGNLEFLTTGQRITGDFTNATVANRLMFQTSTPNSATGIFSLPSGSGTGSYWMAINNSNPTNSGISLIGANTNEVQIKSDVLGSGTLLPMKFYMGATTPGNVLTLDTSGHLNFVGTGRRIKGDFSNSTHINRTLFQDAVGSIGTSIGAVPVASDGGSAIVMFGNLDAGNSSYAQLACYPTLNESRINSGATGAGANLPLTIYTNALERVRFLTSGAISLGATGTNTGTSGQVLTSQGASSPPTWTTISSNTPGGSTSNIQYNNSGSFAGNSAYRFDATNLTEYIGPTSNPFSLTNSRLVLTVNSVSDTANTLLSGFAYGQSATVNLFRGNNTFASPTAVANGDTLARIVSSGYDGSSLINNAGIQFSVDGAVSSNNVPSRIEFLTTTGTAANRKVQLTIDNAGNLVFNQPGQRIRGDFSNATLANRVAFQTSTTNGVTALTVLPNGTGTAATLNIFGSSDPANSTFTQVAIDSTKSYITASYNGTGSYLPLVFNVGGSERLRILSGGAFSFGATGTNTGTSGQVLISQGNGSPPTWSSSAPVPTLTSTYIGFGNTSNELTGSSNLTYNSSNSVFRVNTTDGLVGSVSTASSNTAYVSIFGVGSTGANVGGPIRIQGGAGFNSLAGGSAIVAGGEGGTAAGGSVTVVGGKSYGSSSGGSVTIQGGQAGPTGAGGTVNVYASSGGSTSGNGGTLNLVSGAGSITGDGGPVYVTSGAGGSTSGAGGPVIITGSAASTDGDGGYIQINAGAGIGTGHNGGTISLAAGANASGGSGGYIRFMYGGQAGTELFRFTPTGALSVGGASNYGTSGQIFTSNGNAAPSWQTLTLAESSITDGALLARLADNEAITGTWTFNSAIPTTTLTPTTTNQFATKGYVDGVASGIDFKQSVRVATVANLTASYNNGTAGFGATLTNSGTQAALVIDGVTMVVNDRVLVKDQSTGTQNGIYTVTNIGSGSTNWVLTRATDADNTPNNEVSGGMFVFVDSGTYAESGWVLASPHGDAVLGTDTLSFTQYSQAGTITASNVGTGTGLVFKQKSGSDLQFKTIKAGTGITITNNTDDVTLSSSTSATDIAITNDTTTNATMYPMWVTTTTGNLPAKVSSTKLTFNPSSGLLSTTRVNVGVGGVTTPSLTFSDTDSNSGLYGDAAGSVAIACNGIRALGVTSAGAITATATYDMGTTAAVMNFAQITTNSVAAAGVTYGMLLNMTSTPANLLTTHNGLFSQHSFIGPTGTITNFNNVAVTSILNVANTSTITNANGLLVNALTVNGGSADTWSAVRINNSNGATTVYGIYSNIIATVAAPTTTKWNIYAVGDASNYLAGKVLIGDTTDNGYKLDVTGTANISSTLTVEGRLGVGGTPQTYFGIHNTGTLTGATTQYAERITNTFDSSATAARGVSVALNTAAATYTIAGLQSIRIDNPSKGAGSTITNNYGIVVTEQTAGTNNYGIFGEMTAGANKWNIYMSGNARNYFAGGVEVAAGSTSMTSGFTHVPSAAGAPSGTPANAPTGNSPMYFDTANDKLYVHDGAAWKDVSAPAVDSALAFAIAFG